MPLRACLRLLRAGGTLGMFPAGEVATLTSLRTRKVVEAPWNDHLGKLVVLSKATVVPIYIDGRNSALFHYLGTALPPLRLALLVRELMTGKAPIRLHLGAPLPFAAFPAGASPAHITAIVRDACFQAALI